MGEYVRTQSCTNCGSRSGGAIYTDSFHCFSCGHHENFVQGQTMYTEREQEKSSELIQGEYKALVNRMITEETCKHFGYKVGTYKDSLWQIAPYYIDGKLVGQKLRNKNKEFKCLGNMKDTELFGQHLWKDGGKMVVITEGEIDCMSVSQVQGNKWATVSLPNGVSSAKKAIQRNLSWLEKFESVVLMFDMDDPGQKAIAEVSPLFTPGKCKVARLPMKDANEMLVAGKGAEIVNAIWNAKTYRPTAVLTVSDAFEEAIKVPERGLPFPWESLNELVYGIHPKCSYYLGAGVGIGKTNWAKELQSWLVNKLDQKIGVFMLEESVGRTLKGIAGKFVGKAFHKPDGSFTEEELKSAIQGLDGKVFLYNHATEGSDWEAIKRAIRYMVVSCGVKHIFLDNLTVMVAHLSSSEANDEINKIAKEIKDLLQELDFTLYGFSHLNPPATGASHERGGKVLESQFTGSRALMRFGNYMLGLERNKDPELPEQERNTAYLVLLKDREYGNTGRFPIYYNSETDQFLEPDSLDYLLSNTKDEPIQF